MGKRVLTIITAALKILLLIAVFVLEHISTLRGGLMHHMYYRKMQYMSGLYSASGMAVQLGIMLSLIILVMVFKKQKNRDNQWSINRVMLEIAVITLVYYTNIFSEMNGQIYLVMALQIILGIELIEILIKKVLSKI